MRRLIMLSLILALGGVGMARADGPDIIGIRKAGMDLAGAVLADIKRAVENGDDVAPFETNATALAAWAKQIPGLFPAGSGPGPDTKALAEVWSDPAGFTKSAGNMQAAAEKMSAAAKAGDRAAFIEQYQATGQACGACHKSYRAKKT